MSQTYPTSAGYSLFGSNGLHPDDVEQGSIGNCWFLAAASAVAEVAGRFESNWLTQDYNEAGIYAINMFQLGVPITVLVDDLVPHYGSTYNTVFAKVQKTGAKATWMVILEKAYAKLMGNYAQLIGGYTDRGVNALTGFPSYTIMIESETDISLWDKLTGHDSESDIMTASSNYNAAGHSSSDDNGIAYSHAYTLLGAYEIDLKTPVVDKVGVSHSTQKLIKMRNPWSSEGYKSSWSDDDTAWDNVEAAEQTRIGKSSSKYDGVFFMDITSFKQSFKYTSINYDLADYHREHFMVLGDTTTAAQSPGTGYYCGSSCVAHTFKITSAVTQEVHISSHLHDDRSYPLDCRPDKFWSGIKYNFGSSYDYQTGWFEGPYNFAPQTMSAGDEWTVTLEFNWSNDEITKDFSLVVLGQQENVTIEHTGGLTSQDWPTQGADSDYVPVDPLAVEDNLRSQLDAWVSSLSYTATSGCGSQFFESTIANRPALALVTDCADDMEVTLNINAETFGARHESVVVTTGHDEASCVAGVCTFSLSATSSTVGLLFN